jgi:rhamnosyltransferase
VKVILVDNSAPSDLAGHGAFPDCITIANGENLGIARAQNIGIERAIDGGADVVVFFDQDSRVAPTLLPALLGSLKPGTAAVVAPVSRDAATGAEYAPTRVSRYGLQEKIFADGRVQPYAVDIVLSSGTAATVEAFARAGVMDEELFIDFVDVEWCLRCRRASVPILVVPSAVMLHSIGNRSIDLRFANVLVHGPARSYYQIRNALRLFGKESVPLLLAAREALFLAVHKSLLLLGVSNRGAYLKAYTQGVYDGLRGVTGRNPRPE